MLQMGVIHDVFEKVGNGTMTVEEALTLVTPTTLAPFLRPCFDPTERDSAQFVCQGEGILEGEVSGVLVVSREVADAIMKYNKSAAHAIRYVYCIPEGDIDDFLPIKHADGFITPHKAKTTFSPVQAVQEGVPTIISAPLLFHSGSNDKLLKVGAQQGADLNIRTAERYVTVTDSNGVATRINEGDSVSLSGFTGEIFMGNLKSTTPLVPKLYGVLVNCYFAARQKFGPREAWSRLPETEEYARHADFIKDVVSSVFFRGFQKAKRHAISATLVKTFVNVNNDACMVWARLVASDLRIENGKLLITTDESAVGVGLLRDERMWTTPNEIDVLRMLILGPEALSEAKFEEIRKKYMQIHSDALFNVLSVGTGQMCVARTLCMPYSKFLPDEFDIEGFCKKYALDPEKVRKAFRGISGEREVYHGCRGVRLFCIREDIAEAWLTALLTAAKRATDLGIPVRLRILLATLTIAEEAQRFLAVFDRLAPKLLGDKLSEIVVGVSSMLETAGAYIDFENIFSQSGHHAVINGGLVGTNDFTTACLNMNRGDSPRTIIPGYVQKGIFAASPFKHLHPIVGKAIMTTLHRSRALGAQLQRRYVWGWAGELTYDWDSVQWFAKNAAPAGLDYVSTSPDTMLFGLFAASCAGREARRPIENKSAVLEILAVVPDRTPLNIQPGKMQPTASNVQRI